MTKPKTFGLLVKLAVCLVAAQLIAGTIQQAAWSNVQILSAAEIANVGGAGPPECIGDCNNIAFRNDCYPDLDECSNHPAIDCPAAVTTIRAWVEMCWGFNEGGPGECWWMGNVFCKHWEKCSPYFGYCHTYDEGDKYASDDQCDLGS